LPFSSKNYCQIQKINIKTLLTGFDEFITELHRTTSSIKKDDLDSAFSSYLSYSFHPEIGYINSYILNSPSIEDYKAEKFNLTPIECCLREEIINDLIKMNIVTLNIELNEYMCGVLRKTQNSSDVHK